MDGRPVRGCSSCATSLDVVVLRASGADGYNAPIFAMRGVDSVETIVLARREHADEPAVVAAVAAAEMVFFAGGDQCDYVTRFRGTGLSAPWTPCTPGRWRWRDECGLAILGEHVYDACTGSVQSSRGPRRSLRSTDLAERRASSACQPPRGVPRIPTSARATVSGGSAFLARLMTDGR